MKIENKVVKRKKNQNLKWIKILSIFTLLFCLSAIVYNFYQDLEEKKVMEVKISSLKQEIDKLKENKDELESRVQEIHSESFVEKVAREELGLVEKGEMLYIIVDQEGDKQVDKEGDKQVDKE